MICLLAKIFIHDHENTDSPKVRQGYGVLSGAMGVAFNITLFLLKLVASWISGSISILGDALNNLSDAASSIVTLVGFKLAGQEADEEHPFGHGRIEYIAGLIVSLLIILTGIELIHSSFTKIFHPQPTTFNGEVAVILIFSIIIKLIMFQGNIKASKLIQSAALKSTAIDSISDVFTTCIVLVSAVIGHYFGLVLDGYIGVVVGVLIVKAGINAARDTINPLLGEPPGEDTLEEIGSVVMGHKGVLGVHDIVVHNYGPSRIFMSLHVEVPSNQDLITVHDLIDDIENELRQKYHCTAVIHMDPVMISQSIAELKRKIKHILSELDPNLTFHDFRMIHSKDSIKRLTFDVVAPYKYDLSDEEITDYLKNHIRGIDPDLLCDIEVDHK